MTYGTIKVDTVTFIDAGVDKSVTLSGLVQNPTFSGNVTVTGTLSGVTVTGTTANFTSGNFTNISGGTHTITSGVFAAGSAASPSITFTGDLNTGIYSPGADQVAISTGGSGRLFVDASGNVIVGGTSAAISGPGRGNVTINGSSTAVMALSIGGSAKGWVYHDNTNMEVNAGSTGALIMYTNNAERLRITSAGLVGVGTSSPPSLLTSYAGNVSALGAKTSTGLLIENNGNVGNISQIGLGYTFSSTNHPIAIAAVTTSGAGSTRADLVFATRDLTTDVAPTERMRIDSSGRVGVGTSLPTQSLSIGGSGATLAGTAAISLFDGNSGASRRWSISNGAGGNAIDLLGKLVIGYSSTVSSDPMTGTAAVVIDSSGRVGIGTTSPSISDWNPSSQVLHIYQNSVAGSALKVESSNAVGVFAAGSDLVAVGSISNDPLQFRVNVNEVGRFDTSGRLLVGTSSSASAGDSQYSKLQIRGNTSGSPQLGIISIQREEAASTITTNEGIGEIVFTDNAGNTFAAVVCEADSNAGAGDYPGRLVFSTTADGASSPTERMRISQNGLVTIAGPGGGTFLKLANSGGYDGLHEVDNTAYTIGQNSDVRAMRIGSGANWLTTGVNLAAGGTSWGTYSDERLKTDIAELTGCLDNIKNIRCVSYRLTDVDKTDSKKRLGVIAQDLVGKYDEAVNASRRSEDDETEYLSVQYSDLVPVLLKALQEATAKIETLEAKVAALEGA